MRYSVIVRPILRTVQAITVPSGFLQNAFDVTIGLPTTIVPNIADLQQFPFRERPTLYPKLIVTRHLHELYNVRCVIRAFNIICEEYPHARLTIVGDGPERAALEKLVIRLNLSANVTFQGEVPHSRLPSLYDQHDIFVNASNVDNFPGAILEAFASGLPVVSTRAGGIPYLVEDRVTGCLVGLNDHQKMASRVIGLLKDPKTALVMSRHAHALTKDFTWESVRTKILDVMFPDLFPCAGSLRDKRPL